MFNWVIFAFILIFLYSGYKKGLFVSAVTFFSVFFSTIFALNFFEAIGRVLSGLFVRIELYSQGVAFLAIFLLIYTILYMLTGTFLIERFKVRRLIDGLGGVFFGLGTAFLTVGVLIFGWMMMPAAHRTLPLTTEPGNEFFFQIDEKFIGFYSGIAHRIGGGLPFAREENVLAYIREEAYEKKAERQKLLEEEEKLED